MPRKITKKVVSANLSNICAPIKKEELRPSAGRDKSLGEFYFLEVDSLQPFPNQARKNFDPELLQSLADTISKHGIRQPLTVSKHPEELGKYFVISGERRLRAAKLLNLDKVPCIILEDADNKDEIALVENLQRKDLHPIEIARALNNLLKNDTTLSQASLAKGVGLTKSNVSEWLLYLNLPENIQDLLVERNISQRTIMRRLLKCNNEHAMHTMLGVNKNSTGRARKRAVLNLFIENGELNYKKGAARLTKKDKEGLIEKLEEILDDLKSAI